MSQTDEEKRDRYLLRTYGISSSDYEAMLRAHDGRCWICGRKPKARRLHVEHDHKNERVRGLACWSCNSLLHKASDNPHILRMAADYLESTEAQDIIERNANA